MVRAIAIATLLASTAAPAVQLSLDQAVKLGLDRNTDLRKSLLQQLSAEQDKILARSAILPTVSFNASVGGARTSGEVFQSGVSFGQISSNYSTGNASVVVRQLIFDGGKWWNNLSAGDFEMEAAQANVDEQKLQISYLIEQRFYELVRAQRQLTVLTDAAARSRDQADFTQRLFEGGRATQADVYAARANRDNDEIQRLGAERQVELARADLAAAVGVDPGEPLTVVEPPKMMDEPAAPPALGDAVQRAMAQRPSLKAFQMTLEQNRKLASAAKGDYWPTIALQGSWSRATQNDLGRLFKSPTDESSTAGAVVMSWNVFNGFSTDANSRKAEIQALLSENDLLSGKRAVAADVEKAVAQLSTAKAQARVAIQTEQNASEGLRLAKARQEVGVGTQLEVRDAELKLTQAQISRVGALVDGREAESALRRAQGG